MPTVLRVSVALWAVLGLSSAFAAEPVAFDGETMGTTYSVKLAALPADTTSEQIQAEVDLRLELVNDQMSTWRPESELSRFNRHDGTDWFPVSTDTARVVQTALAISEASDGAFDVTVMPLVNLWRFGPEGRERTTLPTDAEIEAALASVGYRKLHARLDPPALRKDVPKLSVDLSAIAKGYGVDVVAACLDEFGSKAYLVEVGGEVCTRGAKADGTPWKVGVEQPVPGVRRLHRALPLWDQALATSGDYRNFYEFDGQRYSHTIDPRTGRPVEHPPASVSVVAGNCTLADALATTLMVLGPDAAYNWASARHFAALILTREGERVVERATPMFLALFPETSEASVAWQTYLIAFGVFLAAVFLMAVGVVFSNRRIRGSCGGLANLRDTTGRPMCESCSTPSPECQSVAEGQARAEDDPQ